MLWTQAIPLDDIEPEDVARWDHGGATYALYRTEDDTVHASNGLCTHEQMHPADGQSIGAQN